MSGHLQNYFLFLLLCIMIPWTQSVRYCGHWICHGAAYCCGEYLDQCCFYSQIYQFWWFWLIWAGVFFVLATCSYLCWRQKTERSLLMRQQNNPQMPSSQISPSSGSTVGGMATPPPPYQNYQTYDIPGQPPVMMPAPPAYEEVNSKVPARAPVQQEKDKWSEKLTENTFTSHPFTISTGINSLNTGRIA